MGNKLWHQCKNAHVSDVKMNRVLEEERTINLNYILMQPDPNHSIIGDNISSHSVGREELVHGGEVTANLFTQNQKNVQAEPNDFNDRYAGPTNLKIMSDTNEESDLSKALDGEPDTSDVPQVPVVEPESEIELDASEASEASVVEPEDFAHAGSKIKEFLAEMEWSKNIIFAGLLLVILCYSPPIHTLSSQSFNLNTTYLDMQPK